MTPTTNPVREKIVVAADDFGDSATANRNILELISVKKIDRVAVIIDGCFQKTEIFALCSSGIKIDLHLCLPKEIGEKAKKATFKKSFIFLTNYLRGKIKSEKIEKDWVEQIAKFKKLFGKNPDGLNSHQYIHFFPPYFRIALRLGEKFQISYLRFGKKGVLKFKNNISVILNLLWLKNRSLFNKYAIDSSAFLVSLDWIADPENFLKNLPEGKTELVCHPERKNELEILLKYF